MGSSGSRLAPPTGVSGAGRRPAQGGAALDDRVPRAGVFQWRGRRLGDGGADGSLGDGGNGPAIRRSEPVGQGSEPDRARRADRRSGSVSRPDRASSQTRSPTCRRDDRSRSFSRSTADSRSAWGKVAAVIPRSGRAPAGTGSKDWRTAPLAVTHSWGTNRAAG